MMILVSCFIDHYTVEEFGEWHHSANSQCLYLQTRMLFHRQILGNWIAEAILALC